MAGVLALNDYTRLFLELMLQKASITPPAEFESQVQRVKIMLGNDTSGFVSPIYNLMVNAVSGVKFQVLTDNESLNALFAYWDDAINEAFIRNIRTGFDPFVTQFALEYWRSSMVLTDMAWGKLDGYDFPLAMLPVDAEYIKIANPTADCRTYTYTYNNGSDIRQFNEYMLNKRGSWTEQFPTPYLIERVYANWIFKNTLKYKGDSLVNKVIEHVLLLSKGKKTGITYKPADLKKMATMLEETLKRSNSTGDTAVHIDHDAAMDHIIPDISKFVGKAAYEEVDYDLLRGLGLMEIGANRREAELNPRGLIEEIYQCVREIKQFKRDLVKEIVRRNLRSNGKIFTKATRATIISSPVTAFYTDDFKSSLIRLYDRGVLSRTDISEAVGYDIKSLTARHEDELKKGFDVLFYPPIIMNTEVDQSGLEPAYPVDEDGKEIPEEKLNPVDKEQYKLADIFNGFKYKGAPYETTDQLPEAVKKSCSDIELLRGYMGAFNFTYNKLKDMPKEIRESRAAKSGWAVIKRLGYKGEDNKWHLKSQYQKGK